jgi:hypothetical protein
MNSAVHPETRGDYDLSGHFDQLFRQMALAQGAQEIAFPDQIPASVLESAEYFDSFPQTAIEASPGSFFQPAVCYHLYEQLADKQLAGSLTFTSVGRCHRNEKSTDSFRLREFTMREVIFLGPAGWVEDQRHAWSASIVAFAASVWLDARLEVATDPFFISQQTRGKKLLQQLKELKLELQAAVDGKWNAIASFNLHETFFGRRFRISLADGSPASSACVAFGLDRWSMAAVRQLGARAATLAAMERQ